MLTIRMCVDLIVVNNGKILGMVSSVCSSPPFTYHNVTVGVGLHVCVNKINDRK